MKTGVDYLVENILTEADRYNEDGEVIGIELWNAYRPAVDLSEFVKTAKENEKKNNISLLEWIRNNAIPEEENSWEFYGELYTDEEILEVYNKNI